MNLSVIRKQVLVVEDDADVRERMCDMLGRRGYEAIAADGGEAALAYLRTNEAPALILLDLNMPGMSGRGFRVKQLAAPELANIPVIVVSGEPEIWKKSQVLQVKGYLKKPVDPDELYSLVEAFA